MNAVTSLFRLDLVRFRNWFGTFAGIKLLVILGFILVILFIVAVEFILARGFFAFTSLQKEFGQAVNQYSINATLLVLFLIGIASSIASSTNALYKPSYLRFLITTPMSSGKLFVSRMIFSLTTSTWVILALLTPILLAFGITYFQELDFFIRSLAVLLMLVLSSQAIGAMLAVELTKRLGRLSRKALALILLFSVGGSLLLMRFLFPPNFYRLYNAQDWSQFQTQLGQLPLVSTLLPTNWLATTITRSWSLSSLLALLMTLGLVATAITLGQKHFLSSWRKTHEGRFVAGESLTGKIRNTVFPQWFKGPPGSVLTNDILGLVRSSSELAYASFLTGLTVMLLFLIRNVPALKDSVPEFLPVVTSLTIAGLLYLVMTLTARLIYPLMAREKRTAWILYSSPIKRESILHSKIDYSLLIIIIPMLFISPIAVKFLLLQSDLAIIYMLLLVWATAAVSLVQLFLGAIAPNFSQADNLEAASTSGSGLAAIAISSLVISLVSFLFYRANNGTETVLTIAVKLGVLSLLLFIPLYSMAKRKIHEYNI